MGLVASVTFPCITSMLARWAPHTERATMTTLIMAGSLAGTILGFFVSGLLVSYMYSLHSPLSPQPPLSCLFLHPG